MGNRQDAKVMTGGTGRNRPSQHPDHCVSTTETPLLEQRPNNYSQVGLVCHQISSIVYPRRAPQCGGAIVGLRLLDLMQPPAA